MKKWLTEIKAISPIHGELTTYGGPEIVALSATMAQQYCEENGLGYCKVIGELIMDIPCKEGTYEPDWNNATDYDTINNN